MIQNEILLDIMREQPDMIIGADKLQDLQRVVAIYSEIAGNKKLYNTAIGLKLKEQVNLWKGDQFFQEHAGIIWQSLNQKQRDGLTAFTK